jgi:mannose/cellobiose epimerase-like protein (N-acyl-D-glucosamine 2-epimerase family)
MLILHTRGLERHYTIDTAERKLAKARAQRAIDEHDARFDALNDARMAMHAAEAQLATARDRMKRCRLAKTIAEELSPHDMDQRQRAMRELLSAQQAEAEASLACTEAKACVNALEQ